MKSLQIRKKFVDFFTSKGHYLVPSSSLVPDKDPTLMFSNAGMNQFKNVFLGLETRPYTKAVSIQKCVRAGGKHNDLENVGYTKRHHTFFEMMGNFSFGDYFREEAITFCWNLLVDELGLNPKKMYVSVFKDDKESFDFWNDKIGLPKERIYKFDEKDNFWRMGDTGPCGPCTEVYYDIGVTEGDEKDNVVGGEGDRFMEIWNLVLMAYEEQEDGQRTHLSSLSVDTGCGLERLVTVLQNKKSNYHTDLFLPLLEVISSESKITYNFSNTSSDIAMRVLADHSRAISFLILDGVMPSAEGRGYVLRRIIRRALRYAKQLKQEFILEKVIKVVERNFSEVYSSLKTRQKLILSTVKEEEKKFLRTLNQGLALFEKQTSGIDKISGEFAFKMYDTYGFPFDLTCLMAKEKGYLVDHKGFKICLKEARDRSRKTSFIKKISQQEGLVNEWVKSFTSTEFLGRCGHDNQGVILSEDQNFSSQVEAKLLGIFCDQNSITSFCDLSKECWIVFDKTCFYAESGGQVGDKGTLNSRNVSAEILDCQIKHKVHLHLVLLKRGELKVNEKYKIQFDQKRRSQIARHHSATHLLHKALKILLGPSVEQKGSLVTDEKLRFDFTHHQPITQEEKLRIEEQINQWISEKYRVETTIMDKKQALHKGAEALFGEKYDESVRVLSIGPSLELCGGTHVSNTFEIQACFLDKESAVSAGVRRLEAFTGYDNCKNKFFKKLDYLKKEMSLELQKNISSQIEKVKQNGNFSSKAYFDLLFFIEKKKKSLKELQKEEQRKILSNIDYKKIISQEAQDIPSQKEKRWLFKTFCDLNDRKILTQITKNFHHLIDVVCFIGKKESSGTSIFIATKEGLPDNLTAQYLLREVVLKHFRGQGGGRIGFCQGLLTDHFQSEELKALLENHLSS